MNHPELESFETELRSLSPAQPPAELLERLAARRPVPAQVLKAQAGAPGRTWVDVLNWFMPATAVAALVIGGLVLMAPHTGKSPAGVAAVPSAPEETVEIDRELLASYDAIAQLASGEPVRFHCREWDEKVTVRDPARGIAIERRIPRLEVTPVSLETY